jgi:hypothetical protein
VLGAGVGEGDLVAEAGGVEPFAREQLVVEALEVGDVGIGLEQPGRFLERGSERMMRSGASRLERRAAMVTAKRRFTAYVKARPEVAA